MWRRVGYAVSSSYEYVNDSGLSLDRMSATHEDQDVGRDYTTCPAFSSSNQKVTFFLHSVNQEAYIRSILQMNIERVMFL